MVVVVVAGAVVVERVARSRVTSRIVRIIKLRVTGSSRTDRAGAVAEEVASSGVLVVVVAVVVGAEMVVVLGCMALCRRRRAWMRRAVVDVVVDAVGGVVVVMDRGLEDVEVVEVEGVALNSQQHCKVRYCLRE